MNSVLQFIKWLVWGWWHSETVFFEGVERSTDKEAPVFELGGLRISRWLIIIVAGVIVVALIVFAISQFTGVVFTNEEQINSAVAQHTYRPINACILREESTGTTYIAMACLLKNGLEWLWYEIPVVLALVVAFAFGIGVGWALRGKKEEGGGS